uniref:Long-chain-fatty-acid--CoA ligase n=1 Tax=Echeneis naucrates TaxID=173247 RepID=A0A665UJY7_ECHNA
IMFHQEFFQSLTLPDLDHISHYISTASTPMLMSITAVAIATTYYLATRPKAVLPTCDLRMQSVEVPGEDMARRSLLQNGDVFMTHMYDDVRTVYELFCRGVKERTEILGSAFLHKGHSKTTDPYIGIFSKNRPEWTMSELACYTYSLVVVTLYDTLGTEAIGHAIDKASISTIICDVAEKVNLVLGCVRDREHSVKTIVLMETPAADLVNRCQEAGILILSLQEMEPPQPDDLAVICFTSGTTGDPKGAMLTHENIVSNCSAFIRVTETTSEDVVLSFLPLAHMFERVVEAVMLVHGGRIGYQQGDIHQLSDDLNVLKPTVFPVVPRILNRMYDKINGQANTFLKRWVLHFAYRRKEAQLMKGIIRRDTLWDWLIFKKVQDSLGGRVRLILTGAAPVSPCILTFFRIAMSCQVYEGYGQTECTAGCTMSTPGDWSAGHVGAPLPCNMVKLVDVPDMNYLAVNGEGEVCVKGSNVFKGYLKNPEKTAETIDADGWVHTGDIGKWLPNGTLQIVDRKKHIFKLAQGEYIAPEKIENVYAMSEAVAQVFVHGDSLQAYLVAVVVPNSDSLSGWAKTTLGLEGSYQELCGKEVKAAILDDMQRLGKERGLKSFEQVKAIYISTQMFTIENGLLTPTLKAKRNEMRKHFRPQIEEMYAGIKM